MGIPEIPFQKYRPTLNQTIIDLLESIALEEIALSNIVDAEANKIKAFIGKELDFPTNPSNADIIKVNQSSNALLSTVIMKEWLLLKKLETVIQIEIKKDNIGNEDIKDDCEEWDDDSVPSSSDDVFW